MTKEEAKKMLANTKVYVNGKSKEIQRKLFEIGFSWRGFSENIIRVENSPFLFIENLITHSADMLVFKNYPLKEISAEDILNIKLDDEFKDGDIIYSITKKGNSFISIFKEMSNEKMYTYAAFAIGGFLTYGTSPKSYWFGLLYDIFNIRLATEKEKKILFSALKEKDLKWNQETKKIEKIEHKFKPFEKVLVRNYESQKWEARLFMEMNQYNFRTFELSDWGFCIPYEGNEYLLGTNNSPKE